MKKIYWRTVNGAVHTVSYTHLDVYKRQPPAFWQCRIWDTAAGRMNCIRIQDALFFRRIIPIIMPEAGRQEWEAPIRRRDMYGISALSCRLLRQRIKKRSGTVWKCWPIPMPVPITCMNHLIRRNRKNLQDHGLPGQTAFLGSCSGPVSYTHLDVYKRQF